MQPASRLRSRRLREPDLEHPVRAVPVDEGRDRARRGATYSRFVAAPARFVAFAFAFVVAFRRSAQ